MIGGVELYVMALPLCEHIYLTEIHANLSGNTWFPDYDAGEWRARQDRSPARPGQPLST